MDGHSNVSGVISDVQHLVARGTILGKLADYLGDTADAGSLTGGHEASIGRADVLSQSPTSSSANTPLESLQQRLKSDAGAGRRARASRNPASSSSSSSSDSDSGSTTSQRMAKAYKAHDIALGKAVAAPSPVSLTRKSHHNKSLLERLAITGGHSGASTSRAPAPQSYEVSSSYASSPPRPGFETARLSEKHDDSRPSDSSSLVSSSDHSNSASLSSWDSEHGAAQRWDDIHGKWEIGGTKAWNRDSARRSALEDQMFDNIKVRDKSTPVLPSVASDGQRKISE